MDIEKDERNKTNFSQMLAFMSKVNSKLNKLESSGTKLDLLF